MKKKMTFIQSLKEMEVDFNVPSANGDTENPGEMNQSEPDDKRVEVSSVVTMDSDFFTHLLQSASEMEEDELATVAAEMIEKAKTKKVLTTDDFGGDDDYDDDIEDTMDDGMDDEALDQTQTPGQVDQNEMRPEEECEMSGY